MGGSEGQSPGWPGVAAAGCTGASNTQQGAPKPRGPRSMHRTCASTMNSTLPARAPTDAANPSQALVVVRLPGWPTPACMDQAECPAAGGGLHAVDAGGGCRERCRRSGCPACHASPPPAAAALVGRSACRCTPHAASPVCLAPAPCTRRRSSPSPPAPPAPSAAAPAATGATAAPRPRQQTWRPA